MLKQLLAILFATMSFTSTIAYANEECNDPSIMRGEPTGEYVVNVAEDGAMALDKSDSLVVDKQFTVKGQEVRVSVQYSGIAMIQCDFDALVDFVTQLAETDMRNDDSLMSNAAEEYFSKRLGPDKNASIIVYIQ